MSSKHKGLGRGRARQMSRQRSNRRDRRLQLESLESRRVLTTTVFLDFGSAFVDGALATTPAELRDVAGANTGPQLVADFNGDGTNDFALDDAITLRAFDSLIYGAGSGNIDFDGSGTADAADAAALRAAIFDRIAEQFAPFDVTVVQASATTLADVQTSLAANAGNASGQFDAYLFVTSATRDGVSVGSIVGQPGLIATGDRDAGSNAQDELGLAFAEQLIQATVQPAQFSHLFANVASNLSGQSFGVFPTNRGVDADGNALPAPTGDNYALLNVNNVMVEFGGGATSLVQPKLFSRFDLVRGGGNVDPANTINPFELLASDADIGPKAGAGSLVTGTGAYDRIEITPGGAGLANVVVEAYDSNAFDNLIDTTIYTVPLVGGITIEAGAADDVIEIDATLAAVFTLRGGAGADELLVLGTGGQSGSYLPLANDPGAGTITVGGGAFIQFSELTPVTVMGFANFAFTTPSSRDVVTIDSPSAGQNRISGTSDGVAFESLTFFDVTNLTVNLGTNDAVSPDDRFTISEDGLVASGLATLNVIGGAGKDVFRVMSSATTTINITGGTPASGDAGVPPGDTLFVVDLSPSPYPTAFPDGTINIVGRAPINYTGIEPIAVADAFEPNNSISTATFLGNQPFVSQGKLSIHDVNDVDYFRYIAPRTGKLYVSIDFDAAVGDLDLRVHDSLDRTLAVSAAVDADTELVVIPVVKNQTYYFRINGDAGSLNNYTLHVENYTAPTPVQIKLDPASDNGSSNSDGITTIAAPTFIVTADLMSFVDINGDGIYQPTAALPASDGIEPTVLTAAQAAAGTTPGFAVELLITNASSGVSQTLFASAVDPNNPLLFRATPPADLALGKYVVTAAVRTFDAGVTPATSRTTFSPPLNLTINANRPQLAAYFGGTVVVDSNGNGKFDPATFENSSGDRVLAFGNPNDQRLAGKFTASSFQRLAAYGRVNNQYRFVFDSNGNGQIDAGDQTVIPTFQINGLAVVGDFDPATPGDEIGIFDGRTWHLDTNGNRDLEAGDTAITGSMRGYPIAGDFDGDGVTDIGTWQNDTFYLDFNRDGTADSTVNFGAPGRLDRPVVGDFDGDGIADLGLWVPQSGAFSGDAEWRFLLSSGAPWSIGTDLFPRPILNAQFGNAQALPLVGNFGPPESALPVLFIGNPVSQTEGNAGTKTFDYSVTLASDPTSNVTVVIATSDGSATTADNDYESLSQTLTFLPGGPRTQTISVLVNGDTKDELDEVFNVALSNAVGATITRGTATGTIINDDIPPVLSIANVSAPEGNTGTSPFAFTVSLSQASGKQITVAYATANGTATAGSDFTATSGTLTIAPGDSGGTINVSVLGDTVVEEDETFFVNLSSPTNVSFAGGAATLQATGTIVNDDVNLSLSIGAPVAQNEGNTGTTPFVFSVTLSANPISNVTVVIATSDNTATTADNDYQALTQTLTFSPGGALTQNVTVLVNGDTTVESDETFNVTLSNAVGATITLASTSGTINNDDFNLGLTLGPSISLNEGNAGTTSFAFPVTLSNAPPSDVTVVIATSDGTATVADNDYQPLTQTLTFSPGGALTQNVTVLVNGDTTVESDETFNVTLSNATGGATITTANSTGTILNDDSAVGVPVLSIGNVTLQEGNDGVGTFSFLITLSQASTEQITVAYATANGSASAGEDYTATSGTLTIAPGSTDSTVNVSVSGDLDFEADETFFVNLSSPVNVTFPGGGNTLQATGTITNDDAAPAGAIIESAPVSQTAVGAFSLFEPAAATPASQPAAFSTRFRSGKTKTLVLGAPRDLPAGAAPMQPIVPPVAIESLEPIAVASAKSSLPNAAIEPALADRAFAQYFAQEPTYQPAKPLKKKVLVLGR